MSYAVVPIGGWLETQWSTIYDVAFVKDTLLAKMRAHAFQATQILL